MSKPSFASLLRRAGGGYDAVAEDAPEPAPASGSFGVDPARVRPWRQLSPAKATPAACAAMLRDGQAAPVVVRPVFDDAHFEYEAIADLATFAAIRRLREDDPAVRLLVRVELVDDDGAAALAARAADDPLSAAFGGAMPADALRDLRDPLAGPLGDAILATATQIGRAQAARRADGLTPYATAEVLRLLEAVGDAAPTARLALAIVDADARSVTFRLEGEEEMTPEMLARAMKAMVDGAAGDGFAIEWSDQS